MKRVLLLIIAIIIAISCFFAIENINTIEIKKQSNNIIKEKSKVIDGLDTTLVLEKVKTKNKLFLDFWMGMSKKEFGFVCNKLKMQNTISSKNGLFILKLTLDNKNQFDFAIYPFFKNDSLNIVNLAITSNKDRIGSSILLTEAEYKEKEELSEKESSRFEIKKSIDNRTRIISLYKKKYGNNPKVYSKHDFVDSCYWECSGDKAIIIRFSKLQIYSADKLTIAVMGDLIYSKFVYDCTIEYRSASEYKRLIYKKLPTHDDVEKTVNAI